MEINQALATFGFSLKVNENPPYSSFSLYKNDDLVQRNIARFWSVSVSHDSLNQSRDFLLPFLTVSGEKLVANTTGVRPWPGEASENTPPVYYDGEIAYAQEIHGKVSVYAGPNILYIAQSPQATTSDPETNVQGLQTWEQAQDQSKHWALEIDGDVIQDGQDLKKINRYDTVFGFQVLDNQPIYFFTKNGLTYLNINGQSQPYRYDTIVHDKTGNLSIFNPGASGEVIWFYALRDGLWYYVEAGFFQ